MLPQTAPGAVTDLRRGKPCGGSAPSWRVRTGLDAGGALAGRDGAAIDIAPQFAVSIGRTRDEARRRFHASQLYKHLQSLGRTTLREQTGGFEQRNLIGSPEEICERIRMYQEAGVTTFSGMLFVANSVPEMHEAIELFGREVLPHFK